MLHRRIMARTDESKSYTTYIVVVAVFQFASSFFLFHEERGRCLLRNSGHKRTSRSKSKRFSRAPATPAGRTIVRIFDDAAGAVHRSKRSNDCAVAKRSLTSTPSTYPPDPLRVIGRRGGAKSLFVIVLCVSVVAGSREREAKRSRQPTAITFRICSSRSKESVSALSRPSVCPSVRPSFPRDVTSDANRSRRNGRRVICRACLRAIANQRK